MDDPSTPKHSMPEPLSPRAGSQSRSSARVSTVRGQASWWRSRGWTSGTGVASAVALARRWPISPWALLIERAFFGVTAARPHNSQRRLGHVSCPNCHCHYCRLRMTLQGLDSPSIPRIYWAIRRVQSSENSIGQDDNPRRVI